MLSGKKILLIISGGIAAYKSLELIRLLTKNNAEVTCILTNGGAQFITPLSVASLSKNKVYTDLWSLTDEAEMGHIRLSRECDLVLVAPASADIIAKMTHGMANDLATTCLLASDKPVMIAPAMNPQMWSNPATQSNIATLKSRGVHIIEPESGEMACGEIGVGRMGEPEYLLQAVHDFFFDKPLKGLRALVTCGPTYEAIDPVRFIGNRSSGKQGQDIACALRDHGAQVTLVKGVTSLPDPQGMNVIHVESANDMLDSCTKTLPADIAIFAAAVSDWRPREYQDNKIKKKPGSAAPSLSLIENPDILKTICAHSTMRPTLTIGFAAETQNLKENATKKLQHKGCDWIIANEVGADSNGEEKTFGRDDNSVLFITHDYTEEWPKAMKRSIADKIAKKICERFENASNT